MKLEKSNFNETGKTQILIKTQKLKLSQNSKTKNVTKQNKKSNCDTNLILTKLNNSKCDQTQIMTKLKNSNRDQIFLKL